MKKAAGLARCAARRGFPAARPRAHAVGSATQHSLSSERPPPSGPGLTEDLRHLWHLEKESILKPIKVPVESALIMPAAPAGCGSSCPTEERPQPFSRLRADASHRAAKWGESGGEGEGQRAPSCSGPEGRKWLMLIPALTPTALANLGVSSESPVQAQQPPAGPLVPRSHRPCVRLYLASQQTLAGPGCFSPAGGFVSCSASVPSLPDQPWRLPG